MIELDADTVTILHHDGGGRIPLAKLPPDLQKRYNYDPAKSKAAAEARAREDAANGKALQAEMNRASDMRQAGVEPTPSPAAADDSATATSDDATGDVTGTPDTSSPDETHHSISDLNSTMHTLKPDATDPNHHTMDELTGSASAMRHDLSDPSYSTMAHTAYGMRLLGPDPADPSHHTIGELSNLPVDPQGP